MAKIAFNNKKSLELFQNLYLCRNFLRILLTVSSDVLAMLYNVLLLRHNKNQVAVCISI